MKGTVVKRLPKQAIKWYLESLKNRSIRREVTFNNFFRNIKRNYTVN